MNYEKIIPAIMYFSDSLGRLLSDGAFEDITGHAWLLYEGAIIIDITGDQFKRDAVFLNFDMPVYIGEDTEFHRLFDIDRICENCDVNSNTRLHSLYQIIKRHLL